MEVRSLSGSGSTPNVRQCQMRPRRQRLSPDGSNSNINPFHICGWVVQEIYRSILAAGDMTPFG
jgi:hypothetical protein